MRVICLTGGIGSGKSTVLDILRKHGAHVVDSDKIAREIMKIGTSAYEKILDEFGNEITLNNGEIDREKLGKIVFEDKEMLQKLNCITQTEIKKVIRNQFEKFKKDNEGNIFVIEAIIPLKEGILDLVNEVWVVICETELRIKRIMKRNSISRNEVMQRINSQMTNQEYIELADVVIDNSTSLDNLKKEIKKHLNNNKHMSSDF